MWIVASKRRSSFGTDCVQCGAELHRTRPVRVSERAANPSSLALFEMRLFV